MTKMAALAAPTLTGAIVFVFAAPAVAAWNATASGAGRSGAATLGQVAGLSSTRAECTPPVGSGITDANNKMYVTIEWSALTNATSYAIAATAVNGTGNNGVNRESATATGTSTVLTLGSKATGASYSITVSGKASNWTGTASNSVSVASKAC